MLNVRADSVADLDALLRDVGELLVPPLAGITEDLAALGNIQATFPGTTVVQQGQVSQQPAVQGQTCAHGQMTYRTGNQGTANAWAGYFCPLEKSDPNRCRPKYVGK